MAIPLADISHPYQALTVLRQSQLDAALIDNAPTSVNYYLNTYVRNNFIQIGLDVFGVTYDYTNDGVQSVTPPLIDQVALLADNETISGAWTFDGQVTFNAPVTGTDTFTSSGQTRCRAYLDVAPQTIADSAPTLVTFNNESYDVNGMHDNAVNNTRLTIPSGSDGIYDFSCQVTFDPSAAGFRQIDILKSGSVIATAKAFANDAVEATVLSLQCHDEASATDFYEVQVYQTSGAPLDLQSGERITFFSALKVW